MNKVDMVCIHTHRDMHMYTHIGIYYSAIKTNEVMPFVATWIDLEIFILREVSQANINIT